MLLLVSTVIILLLRTGTLFWVRAMSNLLGQVSALMLAQILPTASEWKFGSALTTFQLRIGSILPMIELLWLTRVGSFSSSMVTGSDIVFKVSASISQMATLPTPIRYRFGNVLTTMSTRFGPLALEGLSMIHLLLHLLFPLRLLPVLSRHPSTYKICFQIHIQLLFYRQIVKWIFP